MKKIIRASALMLALLFAFLFAGCGEQLPKTEQPTKGTNINIFTSSYIVNEGLKATELHLRNDYSGYVRYSLSRSDSQEKVEENMAKLCDTLNKERYRDTNRYEKGYKVFYMREGDVTVDDSGRFVQIRFTNLTYCHTSYFKVQTLGEFMKSISSGSEKYNGFRNFQNPPEVHSLEGASEKLQNTMKVWHIQQMEENVRIFIEGAYQYFYDAGNEDNIMQADGSIIFENVSSSESGYFIYTDHPDRTLYIVLGCTAGALIIAAVVIGLVTSRRRKKS